MQNKITKEYLQMLAREYLLKEKNEEVREYPLSKMLTYCLSDKDGELLPQRDMEPDERQWRAWVNQVSNYPDDVEEAVYRVMEKETGPNKELPMDLGNLLVLTLDKLNANISGGWD